MLVLSNILFEIDIILFEKKLLKLKTDRPIINIIKLLNKFQNNNMFNKNNRKDELEILMSQ